MITNVRKKRLNVYYGEYLNDDEITKVMSHFMAKHKDITNAQDILYYLTNEFSDLPTIGIDITKREDIHNAYSKYKNTPEYTADWTKDNEYEKQFGILPPGAGGARIRRTRKSAVKRRKSANHRVANCPAVAVAPIKNNHRSVIFILHLKIKYLI